MTTWKTEKELQEDNSEMDLRELSCDDGRWM